MVRYAPRTHRRGGKRRSSSNNSLRKLLGKAVGMTSKAGRRGVGLASSAVTGTVGLASSAVTGTVGAVKNTASSALTNTTRSGVDTVDFARDFVSSTNQNSVFLLFPRVMNFDFVSFCVELYFERVDKSEVCCGDCIRIGFGVLNIHPLLV
jgi:hypothetical protein